jgi:hypothetical protein
MPASLTDATEGASTVQPNGTSAIALPSLPVTTASNVCVPPPKVVRLRPTGSRPLPPRRRDPCT